MTPEDQRITIAEACGWTKCDVEAYKSDELWHLKGHGYRLQRDMPDYLNDLGAMHEAEKVLCGKSDLITDYIRLLNKGDFGYRRLAFATAAQRAEAFLRALGLWEG